MQNYYDLGSVFISDYQKNLFDNMDNYRSGTSEEKKRLRQIYKEITSEAVYSCRSNAVMNGEGTRYFYSTREKWAEMKEKAYWWWSDVLSATVGND